MAGILLKGLYFVMLVVCLKYCIKMAVLFGVNQHIHNHTPGPCRIVPGVEVGSEDITATSKGIAFISSGMKLTPAEWESKIPSRIFTFDFNHPGRNLSEVKIESSSIDINDVNYLGMSIWEDSNTGKITLFVVNRARKQPSVEVFEYQQKTNTLKHKETVTSDNIISPNDILAVNDKQFYVTNDVKFGSFFELFLPIPTGTVAYYDGKMARIVATGFTLANGINQSPDGRYVYVAGSFDQEVGVFEKISDGSLVLLKKFDMHTTLDNIEVDKKTGDLWLGSPAQPYKTIMGYRGASKILRMTLDENLNATMREVLADDGQLLTGSSVACPYGNKMLVGTVQGQMLYCELLAY